MRRPFSKQSIAKRKAIAASNQKRRSKLPQKAIDAFLDQPRRDLRSFKTMKKSRRRARADALEGPVPDYFDDLQREQQVCFLIGAKYRHCMFVLDTGMGKTLLALSLIDYFRELGEAQTVLVLVLSRANKVEWAREIEKHKRQGRLSDDLNYVILKGSSENKWRQLEKSYATIVLESVGGFTRMVSKMFPPKKETGKFILKPDRALVQKLKNMLHGLVVDESQTLKSHKTIAFRVCKQLRKTTYFTFPMTATPLGKDPQDLWSQMFLTDQGESLGKTLGLFRAALFNEKEDDYGHVSYEFPKKNSQLLNDLLAHSSIEYEADGSSLPPVTEVEKWATLPEEAEQYYAAALEELKRVHRVNMKKAGNAFMRMRQISSGYLGYDDDELGKRAQFEFAFKPKLELLLATIQQVRSDHKIIVFVDFVFSGSMICRELEKLKIGHTRIWGGTKDIEAARDAFDNDASCQVLVLNNQMAPGQNLQVAKYGFYYESPVSPILRKQTRRRFERQYSEHERVFLYDFLVRGTFDKGILQGHARAGGLFDAIIRGEVKI